MPEDRHPSLLIVDDDPLITETLSYALGKDFEVMVSDSRHHAVSLLRQLDEAPQLALVDLGLPPMPHRPDEGFQLISDLLAHSPTMKILVLSGQNDAANARHARTLGAAEFVAKPSDPENLKKILLHALQFRPAEISGEGIAETDPLVGKSPALQKLKSQISQYADSPFPALIEGESGTGKEVVANLLHRLSWRRTKPWFALNCAAIAPTLVEPTLFGYTKGAFTGATQNKSGYFEDAGEGTLFLDEIGELPLELQAKLLRVLENGEYQRVGETQADVTPGLAADPGTLVDQAQRHLQRERSFNLDQMLKAWEQGYIEAAMKLTRGNVSQAAKMLGINRTTLYSRMESLQKQQ